MGVPEKFTLSQDKDGIIGLAISGDVDKDTVLEIFGQLNPFLQQARAQNKKILILVDQTKMGTVDPAARDLARSFLKNTEYDRVAMFGAKQETAKPVQRLLASLSSVLRIRTFSDETKARRWLLRGRTPLVRKARRRLAIGLGFAVLAVFWHFVVAPQSFRLSDDFSYEAAVISYDNFYDERTGGFQGETLSNTKFSYEATSAKDGVQGIKNIFEVRTTAGDEIFAVTREYGINPSTRQHVPGHGDRDREGYLFGPVGADKRDFTYWHINYDAPAHMKFQNEENLLGLTTYHYAADFHADQTKELGHLPGVGETRGVNLDINLQLWIEPATGHLIKYEDRTTAHYYDLATGERLHPWNQFRNSYSFESVVKHVRVADELKEEKLSDDVSTPIFYGIIAALLLVRAAVFFWRSRRGRTGSYSILSRIYTVGLVLALMLTLTFFSWQQTIQETAKLADIQFQGDAHELHDSIVGELTGYTRALQGAKGLFAASGAVDRNDWNAYIDSLGLAQNYPGMLGMGFIQVVPAAQKEAHIAQVRSQGFPNYRIHPDGARDPYSSVVYLEPFSPGNQKAFGYDMLTDAVRRAAMERAAGSGEPAMSGKLELIQEEAKNQQHGVLLFMPVYRNYVSIRSVEERQAALLGYAYAPVRMADLVRSTLGQQTNGLNIEVFDAAEIGKENATNRIYNPDAKYGLGSSYRPDFVRSEAMQVAGHDLVVRYASLPTYSRDVTLQALPGFILFVGILLSLLIAAVVFLQGAARSRALRLAEKMTNDLRTERNIAIINKSKNEAILSSIGDGVFVIDPEGRIMLFNKAAELISGFTADEVFGKPYKEVLAFHNEHDGRLVDEFVTRALSGKRAEMAVRTTLKRKDGTTVPVADSAAPIVNAQGEKQGAVVVFRETTRERQLEQMKNEFLSVASHELRTPMGAVRANIAMILEGDYGPVNKELVEPLTDMKASTVRLVELVNDLLDVARIEAGRTKFTLSEFRLQDVVKSTVTMLAPLGLEKNVPITVKAEGDFLVQADADKIKQVLTNLIGNSLKFTDKGNIKVTVTANKDLVEVAVADTGLGISPDDQKKLFTKFKQISSTQDGKPAGTGLGLYISRELIRKMGGELRIKSSMIGKGSVFAFTLPRPGTSAAVRAKVTIEREAELHPDQK